MRTLVSLLPLLVVTSAHAEIILDDAGCYRFQGVLTALDGNAGKLKVMPGTRSETELQLRFEPGAPKLLVGSSVEVLGRVDKPGILGSVTAVVLTARGTWRLLAAKDEDTRSAVRWVGDVKGGQCVP